MEQEQILQISKEKLTELVNRFESALRMYKFVINNPKYYDRNFHMREAEYLHNYLINCKKEFFHEGSDN